MVIKSIERNGVSIPSIEEMRSQQGQIIAVADLTKITDNSPSVWAIAGQFHWQLENVRSISPIIAKGQLGLWNYP
jgi:hypothetical protein